MTTTYQFEDGKIIFVYDKSGQLKVVNIVHDDTSVAAQVIQHIKKCIVMMG